MATLLEGYTLANDPIFINRVSQALAVCVDTIRAEGDAVPRHDDRVAFATEVIQDVNAYAYRFARIVVGNSTIAANAPNEENVPDGDIQFVVNQVWNDFLPPLPAE